MTLSMRLKRSFLFSLLHSLHAFVAAQSCYYPNGDLSTTDAPCSSQAGAACCPLNWQCLDNGLCYLDNARYFGRYTCTDKSWESSACPTFCTDHSTDSGDQAVQQCSNHGGQYCCDHNRDANNVCCNQNDASLFFNLPQGNPTASIAKLGTPAVATGGSNEPHTPSELIPSSSSPEAAPTTTSSPNNEPAPSTTQAFTPNTTPQQPTTSPSSPTTQTTIIRSSTASASGRTSIVLLTSVITTAPVSSPQTSAPASAAGASSSPSPKPSASNVAAIGGGIGGGVAALLILALLAFFLLRRRRRRKAKEVEEATMAGPRRDYLADQKVGEMEYMYKGQDTPHTTGTTTTTAGESVDGEKEGQTQGLEGSPEIDGREVGAAAAYERRGGGRRPGEATRVEGLGVQGEERVPRDKWEAYELAADRH